MLYDVVIYEKETKRIDTIAGAGLEMCGVRNSVEVRVATILPRINDRYDVTSVPAGKYVKGQVLEEDHLDDWTETRKAMADDGL